MTHSGTTINCRSGLPWFLKLRTLNSVKGSILLLIENKAITDAVIEVTNNLAVATIAVGKKSSLSFKADSGTDVVFKLTSSYAAQLVIEWWSDAELQVIIPIDYLSTGKIATTTPPFQYPVIADSDQQSESSSSSESPSDEDSSSSSSSRESPVNTVAPELTIGNGLIGTEISVTPGTWSGEPDSYEYRLYVADVLTEVTGNTFELTSAEAGLELYYEVRAHNAEGWSSWVASNTMTSGALEAPTALTMPSIVDLGSLAFEVLATTWAANPPSVSLSYQWWEIAEGWSEWQPIAGANSSTVYASGSSGNTIKCQVIATNGESPDGEVFSSEIVVPS